MKSFYKKGKIKDLARWLPHLRDSRSPFVKFLMASNLLRMRDDINSKPITLGADPEFILCERDNEDNIVLFSSEYTTDYFGVSDAEVGADYGLLEFRPEPGPKPAELVKDIMESHKTFGKEYPDCKILKKEAIEYNHKRARILEALEGEKDINYGMNRGKDVGAWASDNVVIGMETGTTLSAYDRPSFGQFNDKLFTAGGHIHVGGLYIMLLSFEQLKLFIRKLDKRVLPLCNKVESKAGDLRRTVYGAPGEFRIKNYGIEYRSPSNAIFWEENADSLLVALSEAVKIAKKMALEVE